MDALSSDLWQRLIALGLCTARDLRRCRARVRRLSRDLPAFDSVWLDALVQLGRLTPFQARRLAASGPEGLCIGPLVLVDRLGSDGRLTSYIARRPPRGELLELTLLHVDAADQPAVLERLREQIASLSSLTDPRVVRSIAAHLDRDQLVAVAPWTAGRTLAELLVRRGRFPISVVVESARQMSAALESLHRGGGLHGDLRLRNVRIDSRGRLQLLRPGLLAAMQPHVTIHARIPADCYDGVAPELIDTHAPRSVASDVYACGCLWWQLLAGRPPFPGGDPLHKLAAHQSRDVDDVRCWRPETPPPLADLIVAMTRRDPAARPAGAAELLRSLHRPAAAPSRRLKQFVASFESAALTSSLDEGRRRVAPMRAAAAATIALLAGVAGLFWLGPRNDWLQSLQASSRRPVDIRTETAPPPEATEAAETVRPAAVSAQRLPAAAAHAAPPVQKLPAPVAGVVHLTGPGPYAAADLAAVGPLTIAGDGPTLPRVIVGESPWRLSGTTVILQRIEIVAAARASSSAGDPGLLSIVSQDLGIADCRLEAPLARPDSGPIVRHGGLIHWRPIEERAATGGRIAIQQSAFLGDADALVCAVAPRSVQVQRSLKAGRGSWLSLPAPIRSGRLPVAFRDCTFRGGDALVEGREFDAAPPDALLLTLERCLLDPHPDGGLLQIGAGGGSLRSVHGLRAVQVSGFETWLRQGAELAVSPNPFGPATKLDATELSIEGLQFNDLHFAGPVSRNPADARLAIDRRTGLSADRCGCPPEAFAAWEGGPYNSAGPSQSAGRPAPVAHGEPDRPAR